MDVYADFDPENFNREQYRCAAVVILTNLQGEIDNNFMACATGMTIRSIQPIRKRIEEDHENPLTMISKQLTALMRSELCRHCSSLVA